MSVESMALALHHSRAKGTARLVLVGIANHDGDGGAWPSIGTLRKYAGGVARSTVQRAIAELVELGELAVDVQQGGTRDTPDVERTNRYRVLLSCPPDCDGTSQHRTDRDRPGRPGRPRKNRAAPTLPRSAHAAGGAAPTLPGGAAPTLPEPSSEPPVNTAAVQTPTTEAPSACGQPPTAPEHDCDHGWLYVPDDAPAVPCAVCRPAHRRRTR